MNKSRLISLLGAGAMAGLALKEMVASAGAATSEKLDYQRGVEAQPLTEREIQLIARLLSDPSIFPREFKRWVTDHAADTVDIAKSQVHGLINSQGTIIFSNASWEQLAVALCPMVLPYPVETPPSGWLNCDGAMYPEIDYPDLFGFLGHRFDTIAFGAHFGVPDLRGRSIYGMDPAVGSFFNMPFGLHEGSPAGNRGPWHNHTYQDNEMINVGTQLDTGATWPRFAPQDIGRKTDGGGGTLRETGSFMTMNYIIASGKVPD